MVSFLVNLMNNSQASPLNFKNIGLKIEDQVHPADYSGVDIKELNNGSELSQCTLINSIIEDVGHTDAKTKPVLAKVLLQLHAFRNAPPFSLNFNC